MSETANVDLSFIAKQMQAIMTELRAVRKDCSDARALAVQSYELAKRRDRREIELRDDLEMILKMELGGNAAHLQTIMDAAIARVEDKVVQIEARLDRLEGQR